MQNSDFIPAPAQAVSATATAAAPSVNIDSSSPIGLGTTQLIIAVVIILALAVGLFFLRGGVKNALASGRATLDSANLAANAWFIFLLLLSALVVFGVLGSLFSLMPYTASSVGFGVVGLVACGLLTAAARKTRK